MPKVAEHVQPKRAAERPKVPKNGSSGQGGARATPRRHERFTGHIKRPWRLGPSHTENGSSGEQGGAKLAPKAGQIASNRNPGPPQGTPTGNPISHLNVPGA